VSWVKNFPRNGGQWELVATHAKQHGMLTERFVAHLRKHGAAPEKIAGVWMVRADQWADVEPLLSALPKVQEIKPAAAAEQPAPSLATGTLAEVYRPVEDRIKDQGQLLEQLKRQVAELLAARGQR
jgi:hypothetical protein